MLKRLLCCFILMLGLLPGAARAEVDPARDELSRLLELQHELLGRAAMAAYQEEVESLRPRLQTLVFDYERFLRTYPNNVEGMVAYSMLLGNALVDERDRAEALLLRANTLDPNLAVVKNQLGKYVAEAGRPLEAINYFLAAAELEPEEPLYHFQIGQLLAAARADFLSSGEWTPEQVDTAMVHALEEAVRLDPENFAYAYKLAESHYDVAQPDWTAALAAWQTLEARAVDDPLRQQMVQLHQANVLLAMNRLDDAEAILSETFQEPLREQQSALVAKLARLRDPSESAPAAAESAPVVATKMTVEVPAFEAGDVPPVGELKASTVVEMAKALPAELPTAPMVEEAVDLVPDETATPLEQP